MSDDWHHVDWESVDVRDLRAQLHGAADRLERLADKRSGRWEVAPFDDRSVAGTLSQAAYLLLRVAATTLGECRQQTPFKPLRPVIDSQGKLKWCCGHSPQEHCAS